MHVYYINISFKRVNVLIPHMPSLYIGAYTHISITIICIYNLVILLQSIELHIPK